MAANIKTTSNLLTYLIIGFFFFVVLAKQAFAATTLFNDNFQNGSLANWTVFPGNVVSPQWQIFNDPNDASNKVYGVNLNNSFRTTWSAAGDASWTDYELNFDILAEAGVDKNFGFRVADATNFVMYGLHLVGPGTGQIALAKFKPGAGADVASAPHAFVNNTWYHIKIIAVGNNIKVSVNNNQVIDYTDNGSVLGAPILNGKIAAIATTGTVFPTNVRFDNIVVTDLSETDLEVPFFSQNSEPWQGVEYDGATKWSNDPTINRWGCAMTSAAMILKYHGFDQGVNLNADSSCGSTIDTNPGNLNAWLKQNKGYNSEGALLWDAVIKYAKNANRCVYGDSKKMLEFKYATDFNNQIIQDDLEQGKPGVVKISKGANTHFVATRGINSENKLRINDPEQSTAASSHLLENLYPTQDTVYKYGKFIPSNTDLSYLYVSADPGVNITVTDQNGNVPPESYLYLHSISPDGDLNQSGSPTQQIFELPKPASGSSYLVRMSSETASESGLRSLEIDFFDSEANQQEILVTKLLGTGEEEQVLLEVDEQVSETIVNQQITFDSIIANLGQARDLGLIKSKLVANAWILEVKAAKKLQSQNKAEAAKKILVSLVKQIQLATPRWVDTETSELLVSEIEILKGTF